MNQLDTIQLIFIYQNRYTVGVNLTFVFLSGTAYIRVLVFSETLGMTHKDSTERYKSRKKPFPVALLFLGKGEPKGTGAVTGFVGILVNPALFPAMPISKKINL